MELSIVCLAGVGGWVKRKHKYNEAGYVWFTRVHLFLFGHSHAEGMEGPNNHLIGTI